MACECPKPGFIEHLSKSLIKALGIEESKALQFATAFYEDERNRENEEKDTNDSDIDSDAG